MKNCPGTTLGQYARARPSISKWKASVHRELPNFPAPISIGPGVRALRYYDAAELDRYFRSVEGDDARFFVFTEGEGSDDGAHIDTRAGAGRPRLPDTLAHRFSFAWTDGNEPGVIAEDD